MILLDTSEAGEGVCVGGRESIVAVDQPAVIVLDTSEAGEGHVTCHVTCCETNEPVEVSVDECEAGQAVVQYTPTHTGQLSVQLLFGGQLIPHGDFTQQAVDQVVQEEELTATKVPRCFVADYFTS